MATVAGESLQFYGRDMVVAMFQQRKAEAWSLWHRKQFLFKGIGWEELDGLLENLESGQGNATYTLKVYDSVKDVAAIKERTESDGSFNFKLFPPEEREASRMGYRSNLEKEVLQLREELTLIRAQQEEEDEEEEENGLAGMGVIGNIIGLLQDPDKLEKLINIGKALLTPQQPQFVGNVTRFTGTNAFTDNSEQMRDTMQPNIGAAPQQPTQYSQEDLTRLSKALDILGTYDAKAIEHLEKLASIAQKTPDQFLTLTTLLDAY
jgi:hypothetical protein